jgi:hypothetical protein
MSTKINAGLREEATERITTQYEEGLQVLSDYPALISASIMGGRRNDEETYIDGLKQARDRWINKTRQLLRKYFSDEALVYEFANEVNTSGGYGNLDYDPIEESLRAEQISSGQFLSRFPIWMRKPRAKLD